MYNRCAIIVCRNYFGHLLSYYLPLSLPFNFSHSVYESEKLYMQQNYLSVNASKYAADPTNLLSNTMSN